MKRSPLKRKSKTSRAKLMAELDSLAKGIIKKHEHCQRCGQTLNLHGHHVIYVSQSTFLRWDTRNIICLCRDCHFWVHKASTALEEDALAKKCLSEEDYAYIFANQRTPGKFSMSDLREIKTKLEAL